ncbi:tail fiber domain-containing protein [Roseomonas indoligenes]|uniref:Tail fiber domain-containing protein n=1 Tax=Roseomonas indoligenes TaxID=2820811 RepID=A0A940S5H8_9PROT|nr:tail fiber domain-containing protein [Pararoseomonas indoligenes]MBP0493034.1 tail fiber domain-containing protein [Pararoseomonas indoligenes]
MGIALRTGNRVLLTTTTTGTGTYQLSGSAAAATFRTLAEAGIASGSRVMIEVVDSLTAPTMYEEAEGIYTAGSPATITRAQIKGGSNGTSAVNWPAGTRFIYLTVHADRTPIFETDGSLAVPGTLRVNTVQDVPGSQGLGDQKGATLTSQGSAFLSSSTTAPLNVNVALTAGGNAALFTSYGGLVGTITTTATATSYNTTSDRRLKDEDGDVDPALLLQLRPRRFRWKSNGEKATGFFAQEVYAVFPEAVTPGDSDVDGQGGPEFRMWAMDLSKMMPLAVATIQAQAKTIQDQGKAILDLQVSLAALTKRVASIKIL